MKRILIIWMAMCLAMTGMSQVETESYESWFESGNAAYNEGNFDQALSFYSKIQEAGLESAPLFYNMGNTYYKQKNYPMSILYYEKALKLDPGNEDIKVNLEIANMAIVDKINKIPQSFIARWWNGLRFLLSADGWAWVSVAAFGLFLLCLYAFLMSQRTGWRKTGFFAGLAVLVCLVLSVAFAIDRRYDLKHQDEAIVMSPTVTVKSSPNASSVDLFVLHEGTKVSILDSAEEWKKVKIADGSVGWLLASDMIAF